MNTINIGLLLKNKRTDKNLTMKQVADFVNVSESTISRWESGEIKNMKRDKIAKLSDILSIDPALIMGWDEEKQKSEPAKASSDNEEFKEFFNLYKNADPEHQKLALIALTSGQQHS